MGDAGAGAEAAEGGPGDPGGGSSIPALSGGGSRRSGPPGRWVAIALVIFSLITAFLFREVLRAGPASFLPVSSSDRLLSISKSDVTFEAWLVARNAYTLSRHPHRLFDTEHCAPAKKTLTLGIPMITMGLFAIPVSLVTPNPAIAYNAATATVLLLSAVAMFLLVREWTGSPAAGVAAGILYAFNPVRTGIFITHPSVWDSSGLVLALFFAQRWFTRGRWRDAVGLTIACSLQMGASFYPFLAAVFLAPAFVLWLVGRHGFRHVRPRQVAFVAAGVLLTGALVFGPYLEAHAAAPSLHRTTFYFSHWSSFLPGGDLFLGWGVLILATIGLLAPRKATVRGIEGDPRWALLVGAFLVTVIACGPFNNALLYRIWDEPPFLFPNFYTLLASVLPGLDSIRIVSRLSTAAQVVLCILAGMGTASVLGMARRSEPVAAAALIGLAAFSVLPEPHPWSLTDARVRPETLEFFESLQELGNAGPILELPPTTGVGRVLQAPQRILVSAYHRRRTSSCRGSYPAPGRAEFMEIVGRLPSSAAVRELKRLGFTTVVLHHPNADLARIRALRFKRSVQRQSVESLRLLLETEGLSAYEIGPPFRSGAAPRRRPE
ncbi:MAG: hypothetical protein ACE5FL_05910 [Myxococcota bacterium]